MSLQDWLKSGWLTAHHTSRQEIAELFAVADRDLIACQTPGLVADWRMTIAYNAALQLATAALAAAGFTATRSAQHYRVFQTLSLTLGLDTTVLDRLDAFRKKRNMSGYERVGVVSDTETDELVGLAQTLRRDVAAWIGRIHPELKV